MGMIVKHTFGKEKSRWVERKAMEAEHRKEYLIDNYNRDTMGTFVQMDVFSPISMTRDTPLPTHTHTHVYTSSSVED